MAGITSRVALALGIALMVASCDKDSPTSPSDPPEGGSSSSGNISVKVEPNPVPFSGVPVSDAAGCAALPNTWYYEHVFRETGGAEVKFTNRVDSFDGWTINTLSGLNIVVPANGELKLRSRWCSANATDHEAQSSFSGTDANGNPVTVIGPKVRLLAP
jgi:hypothetical protein